MSQYWKLVKPVWQRLALFEEPGRFVAEFARVPPASANLFAAHWCHSETSNGGLWQLFYNSTGVLAPEAVVAFRILGLKEAAAIVEEAMAFFAHPYPRAYPVRRLLLAAVEDLGDPFDQLTDRYFEASEDFVEAADDYASGFL